jgi:putative transposase
MKRTRRISFNDPGHAHFLTFSCFRHCQLFTDNSVCSLLANSINRARSQHGFDLWAYVFMPDHVHLLLRPRGEDYSVPQILKTIKGQFAKRLIDDWKTRHPYQLKRLQIQTPTGIGYRVWQRGGGFDRNLFSHDLIRKAIAYIEDNPVRKGLVSIPADWKWSSARARLGHSDEPLEVDEASWELVDAE